MATCNYCNSTIFFGGKSRGAFRFCDDRCERTGMTLLNARNLPEEEVKKRIRTVHQGACPRCGGPGPVDVHTSHQVWSALVLTCWKSKSQICCRRCGTELQLGNTAFSLLFGWWGFPFGLIITPVQIVRNLAAILGGPNADSPSPALERTIRIRLALRGALSPTRRTCT
jgi:hypothetical protein